MANLFRPENWHARAKSQSSITNKLKTIIMSEKRNNMTPGEILVQEYMKPIGLTQNALGRALGVPRRVSEIIRGKCAITLDTSLRLGRFFRQSPTFWPNVQNECDVRSAKQLMKRIVREVRPKAKPKIQFQPTFFRRCGNFF